MPSRAAALTASAATCSNDDVMQPHGVSFHFFCGQLGIYSGSAMDRIAARRVRYPALYLFRSGHVHRMLGASSCLYKGCHALYQAFTLPLACTLTKSLTLLVDGQADLGGVALVAALVQRHAQPPAVRLQLLHRAGPERVARRDQHLQCPRQSRNQR